MKNKTRRIDIQGDRGEVLCTVILKFPQGSITQNFGDPEQPPCSPANREGTVAAVRVATERARLLEEARDEGRAEVHALVKSEEEARSKAKAQKKARKKKRKKAEAKNLAERYTCASLQGVMRAPRGEIRYSPPGEVSDPGTARWWFP